MKLPASIRTHEPGGRALEERGAGAGVGGGLGAGGTGAGVGGGLGAGGTGAGSRFTGRRFDTLEQQPMAFTSYPRGQLGPLP